MKLSETQTRECVAISTTATCRENKHAVYFEAFSHAIVEEGNAKAHVPLCWEVFGIRVQVGNGLQ